MATSPIRERSPELVIDQAPTQERKYECLSMTKDYSRILFKCEDGWKSTIAKIFFFLAPVIYAITLIIDLFMSACCCCKNKVEPVKLEETSDVEDQEETEQPSSSEEDEELQRRTSQELLASQAAEEARRAEEARKAEEARMVAEVAAKVALAETSMRALVASGMKHVYAATNNSVKDIKQPPKTADEVTQFEYYRALRIAAIPAAKTAVQGIADLSLTISDDEGAALRHVYGDKYMETVVAERMKAANAYIAKLEGMLVNDEIRLENAKRDAEATAQLKAAAKNPLDVANLNKLAMMEAQKEQERLAGLVQPEAPKAKEWVRPAPKVVGSVLAKASNKEAVADGKFVYHPRTSDAVEAAKIAAQLDAPKKKEWVRPEHTPVPGAFRARASAGRHVAFEGSLEASRHEAARVRRQMNEVAHTIAFIQAAAQANAPWVPAQG